MTGGGGKVYESVEREGVSGSNESSTRDDNPRGVCAVSMIEARRGRRGMAVFPRGGDRDCAWPRLRGGSIPNAEEEATARDSLVDCVCPSKLALLPHAGVPSGVPASVGAIEKSMYWNGDESSSSTPVEAGGEAALRMLSTSP